MSWLPGIMSIIMFCEDMFASEILVPKCLTHAHEHSADMQSVGASNMYGIKSSLCEGMLDLPKFWLTITPKGMICLWDIKHL
jgi:hypothetical protein